MMNYEKSKLLYDLIKWNGLYDILKREENNKYILTNEERKDLEEWVKSANGLDDDDEIEVLTLWEYLAELEEMLKDMGIPENIIYYVDLVGMTYDEIMNGTISYECLKDEEGNHFILIWREA